MDDDGTTLRQSNTSSLRSPGSTAAIVCGGLLLAGIAVSRVFKRSTTGGLDEWAKRGRHEPEDPPDPELGAWG